MRFLNSRSALVLSAALVPLCALASSHREAPSIAGMPRLDGTDFYMFRSYEPGRSGYVTFIANYIPLQDPEGGPNFFNLDSNGVYSIHIDNDGDAVDDLRFDFRFSDHLKGLAVESGGKSTPIPLVNIGPVDAKGTNVNASQTYSLAITSHGKTYYSENLTWGGYSFNKPLDNIGNKSVPNYEQYAAQFVQEFSIPYCPSPGRVFVGQRKEGFVINIGEVFDLVNLNPIGPRNGKQNALFDKNVTSLAIEIPLACATVKGQPVIGAYTTSTTVQPAQQVSRLGMPLVNELVIGLPDKDKFNASSPADDAQFLSYVTNPSLPVLLNVLFGNAAVVPATPRNDLVAVFLTGVPGLNQPEKVTPSEMLRLNTSIAPTAPASQNDLGVLGKDLAGFPNGRRPYDDIVDITLRVAEGALCGAIGTCGSEKADPNHGTPYTDGAQAAGPDEANAHPGGMIKNTDTYLTTFPYLNTPIAGSPNTVNGLNGLAP